MTDPVCGSTRQTVLSSAFATHNEPSAAAMPDGVPPRWIVRWTCSAGAAGGVARLLRFGGWAGPLAAPWQEVSARSDIAASAPQRTRSIIGPPE